ncbi:hypothetical protein ACH5AL_02250 [Actinacidiphila glaucinigra]|uniref:hypothetical protein n=1 Tax=Actinacidiphila glaucinigra TaxID=235986 RepID=UPI0037B7B050
MPLIDVVQGDITAEETDAVVTAADESLMGRGGVDGAVHRAAVRDRHRRMPPSVPAHREMRWRRPPSASDRGSGA